jgi:hypothetical protein
MRLKALSIHGDYGGFTLVLLIQSRLRTEYAKSILACTENSSKDFKRIRRIRQDALHREYADRYTVKLILFRRIFDQN